AADYISYELNGAGIDDLQSHVVILAAPLLNRAATVLATPPILSIMHNRSLSNYVKAPHSLSLLSQTVLIFMHSIISLGLSLRQCPSRCTFRAGRNLPDKEFRYLRTVIVTAAVYWGFGSVLRVEP